MSKQSAQPLLVSAPAGAGLPQYYQQPPAYQTFVVPVRIEVQPVQYRRSPLRRFLCAFFLATALWVTLKTLLIHHYHHGRHDWDWPIPSDMVLGECVTGSAWGTSAVALTGDSSPNASFEIPLDVDTVLLLSSYRKSSFSTHSLSGTLDITTSSNLSDSANIIVHSFDGMRTDKNLKACLMTGEDGRIGVGIFRKGFWWDTSATFMKISLVLPATTTLAQVEALKVNLPNFSIHVGNLKDSVDFQSVSLKTTNAAVEVNSLSAARVLLQTSNARINADSLVSTDLAIKTSNSPITGTYNTSDSLHITTSNAPINVAVGLANNDKTKPTVLVMTTSNNRLDAKVTLSTKAHKGGNYSVLGRTSNGPLAISIPGSPIASALNLNARTSNAAAEVKLHGAYQGTFGVSTSLRASANVTRLDKSGDDSRHIDFDSNRRGEVRGSVYEKESGKELGEVRVRTSNAPVVLFV
ncbi:hypothetical protein B0H16DRAFT_1724830 [Mycena metata]|uniref:Uncharacterized protein n=1 Tax=Mycena metata TaxID=1033252 RepID=A0AAD7ITC1_9AGAR|nr:hypothetical protein B0H16DRAFT_1724830 [Mycena metata]